MTQRFEVPAVSKEAAEAYFAALQKGGDTYACVGAALAVDLPRIVRSEVERFGRSTNGLVMRDKEITDYCEYRFGAKEEGVKRCNAVDGGLWCGLVLGHKDPHFFCQPVPPELEACTHPDCGIVTPHAHGKDKGIRVAARPSGEPEKQCNQVAIHPDEPMWRCELSMGHTGPHRQGRHDWGTADRYPSPTITPLERAFLRALAEKEYWRGRETFFEQATGTRDYAVRDTAKALLDATPETR